MNLNVGLVYDLRDDYLAEGFSLEQVAEFDSAATIQALEQTLRDLGCRVERIGHGRALAGRLVAGDRWDLVFTIAEGVRGRSREAQVPALLEMYGVPYTFSDPLVCAVTLDKAVAKRIARSARIRTAGFAVVENPADIDKIRLAGPLFAKPIAEGTGKGIDNRSRIASPDQLRQTCLYLLDRFQEPVLVEEFLPGREFTTALLGTGDKARVLGTMEILLHKDAPDTDYSFEMKEQCEKFVDYSAPPKGRLRRQVEYLALAAHKALQCRDASRVDIRLDRFDRPTFMEVNPLPGLHPQHSDLPLIATQEGMPYIELVRSILVSAAGRYGLPVDRRNL